MTFESSLAHLERQYDELNQIVIRQDKALTRLMAVVERIDTSFRDMEMDKIKANNQKPPHYEA